MLARKLNGILFIGSKRVMRFFMIFCLLFPYTISVAEDAVSRLPNLEITEVIRMSNNYIKTHGIDADGFVITHIFYDEQRKVWRLTYKSDSLVIGDGAFGIKVFDKREEIELIPGL